MKPLVAPLLTCDMFAGCNSPTEPPRTVQPKYHRGEFVDMYLGPHGQVLRTYQRGDNIFYDVRVATDHGPKTFILHEFELRAHE